MRNDIYDWQPISLDEVVGIFAKMPGWWCIAGGWALDLHLGYLSRAHADIDIVILRSEQADVYERLSAEWKLYKAEQGKLSPWEPGEWLETTGDVWACRNDDSPWAYQLMLLDTDDRGNWIYGRERSIRLPLADIANHTVSNGIPYLKPEIQLLYKGGSRAIRDKDQLDFRNVAPSLPPDALAWLESSLFRQFARKHVWFDNV